MDLLRVIAAARGVRAVAAFALALAAGCSPAGAQPSTSSGLTPPAGWTELPEIAAAAAAALRADGVTLEGSEAWGEPARGCYAVWLALRGPHAAAAQVLAGLEAQGITLADVVKPETADGIATARFEKAPYRGRLRARASAGRLVALACFANEREPASCEAPCTTLLGGLP